MSLQVRAFITADQQSVIDLWKACDLLRDWNDPVLDILRKQSVGADLFLVAVQEDRLVATVMGGYDGHRGWMNYLAVDPQCRKLGFARAVVHSLEQRLKSIGCPKLNLQIRNDNIQVQEFYRRLGYSEDLVTSMGKRLISDIPDQPYD